MAELVDQDCGPGRRMGLRCGLARASSLAPAGAPGLVLLRLLPHCSGPASAHGPLPRGSQASRRGLGSMWLSPASLALCRFPKGGTPAHNCGKGRAVDPLYGQWSVPTHTTSLQGRDLAFWTRSSPGSVLHWLQLSLDPRRGCTCSGPTVEAVSLVIGDIRFPQGPFLWFSQKLSLFCPANDLATGWLPLAAGPLGAGAALSPPGALLACSSPTPT